MGAVRGQGAAAGHLLTLAAGDGIDALLRRRATLLVTGENAGATGPLRGATVGLLGRFREALRDEVQDEGSTLPADHEARVFAYIDKLNADRERALRGRAASQPQGDAAAPVPTTPEAAGEALAVPSEATDTDVV